MAEFDEITDAERVQIAQHFLLNSPPAQYGLVSEDVKKLLPKDCLPEAVERGIAKTYNFKNCRVVKAPSGNLVALHSSGEVNESHSIDTSNGGAVFKINHLTMETSDGEEGVISNQDKDLELKRAALQAEIDTYIKDKYPCDAAAGSVYAKDGALTIVITGERVNLRNMYSGKWNSQFLIDKLTGDKVTLSGEIKVHNHYFEEGNIQMQTAKPIAGKEVTFSSEKELAEKVLTAITEVEQETQKALHFIVDTAHVTTLKELRKASTVHKVKMAWNKNSAKMVGQLTGKSQDNVP